MWGATIYALQENTVNRESWLHNQCVKLVVLFIGVLVPLWLFGSVAEDVVEHEVFFFDRPILLFLHSHVSALLDSAMVFFSKSGSAVVLVPFNVTVFAILMRRCNHSAASFWALSVSGAALLNLLAKHAFARTRPDLWIAILPETTFSFPSGHAMQSMAVVAALTLLAWPTHWRWAALVLGTCFVFLVALSRVYLGLHYPSDILGGWTASLVWVIGLSIRFKGRLARKGRRIE
jgi:membrane-associated phospholipid phosphatase